MILKTTEHFPSQAAMSVLLAILFIRIMEWLFFHYQLISGNSFILVVFVFLLMSAFSLSRLRQVKMSAFQLFLFLSILALPVISVMLQSALLSDRYDYLGRSSLQYAAFICAYGVTWFLVGVSVSNFTPHYSVKIPFLLLLISFFFVVQSSNEGRVDYAYLREVTGVDSYSHLWITEGLIIFSFLSYAGLKSLWLRVLVFSLSVASLFLAGSRSGLLFFIVTIVFYELFFSNGIKAWKKVVFMLVMSPVLLAISYGYLSLINPLYIEHFLLIFDRDSSGSWQERTYALNIGLNLLHRQILFGDPTLLASELGNVGWYIHNALSGWQFFGLPFFLVSCVAYILAFAKMVQFRNIGKETPFFRFKSLMLLYTALNISLTVFVGSSWFWFTLGLWLAAAHNNRQKPVVVSKLSFGS
ncbi:O-antigen ligase family protein [Halomonas sp. JS92-SW72]|uniref:O-antigen ligase family protein n=1 Tax=Halomonas sp. JS92-SW72 TaxID=2306583 RepID=UPI000E5B18DA|nr:O-antigen ligase family protein [Halomonas sp. JS92-SW72]AXY43694.1 O-antigen ligase domain-containing protein [Halomonas sp. JS92-SW72]